SPQNPVKEADGLAIVRAGSPAAPTSMPPKGTFQILSYDKYNGYFFNGQMNTRFLTIFPSKRRSLNQSLQKKQLGHETKSGSLCFASTLNLPRLIGLRPVLKIRFRKLDDRNDNCTLSIILSA
ncbi:MAG: hypothetical protein PUJ13_00205, partial [Bacteroidales bacterium]|nr:hypothetical protein [Bacteroidales bacterium]